MVGLLAAGETHVVHLDLVVLEHVLFRVVFQVAHEELVQLDQESATLMICF